VSDIMTIGECAQILRVTEQTVCRTEGTTQMLSFKLGGIWRFSKGDIDEWIKRRSMEAIKPADSESGDKL
jgi:excisionase family DNA binding protein